MSRTRISQREARQMKRELAQIRRARADERVSWARDWPGGFHIASINLLDVTAAKLAVAQTLKHALVVRIHDEKTMHVFALPMTP